LTWQITSNKNNGTTGSIPANNSNVVCSAPGQRGMMDEAPEAAELRVYPNPSSGMVFLQLPDGGADAMAVEVYNALGALCPVRVERSSDTVVGLDLSTFGHGLYIIHIVRDGQVETRRVIIE
ncbi:MAG: T9SS type A sorting domain-containing protein, partial [Flavobacteriales bacterium]|nr:T9SS type A sorting domain-containing protein [Flavobacteriales bacterium]